MSIRYNGKTIAGNYRTQIIPNATEEQNGIIKIATEEDINLGVDNSVAVTPLYLNKKADKEEVEHLSEIVMEINNELDSKADVSDLPNLDSLATKDELNQGLANKQEKGDYALKSELPTDFYTKQQTDTLLNSKANNEDIPDVSDFITMSDVEAKKYLTSIPTEYVTDTELNAKNYATQTEVMQAIASIPQFKVSIVSALPTNGEKMVLYLVPKEDADNDIYNEYVWLETTETFELLGSTAVDLTDYATKSELNNGLSTKANDSAVVHKTGNETISGDKTFSNTISAEHGKFGKKLSTYRYNSNESPTTTYYWYKIFQSSTSSQCVNFEIMAHSDNNYPQFAKYTISVSNYTNTSTSIVVYNHGKIGATPNIKVALDAEGNVYLQANCIWDCVLTANNVYGNATVPYTNMGYGVFGTPVGFESIGMITSSGALRYLKASGTVTYSTPEIDALATKAKADDNGNTITSTYATKSELTSKQNKLVGTQTVAIDENGLNALGVLEKNTGNAIFDWIGTLEEWEIGRNNGSILDTYICFITND